MGIAGVVTTTIIITALAPTFTIMGVHLSGVTARDLPLMAARLASWVKLQTDLLAAKAAARTNRIKLRSGADRAFVEVRRAIP